MKPAAVNPFKIYRSSAGSGKTYTLARTYLELALAHPHQFRHILAVTFTNKATKEMKERIVAFLDALAHERNPELRSDIAGRLSLAEAEVTRRAKLVLQLVLHNYSQFFISTIDSFFQRVIRAFAKELGLLGSYTVELDEAKVRRALIDQLLEDAGTDPDLTRWLVEFAHQNIEDSRHWDIKKDIDRLARELFTEEFKSFELAFAAGDAFEKRKNTFTKNLYAARRQFEQAVQEIANAGVAIMTRHGLQIEDFKYANAGGPSTIYRKVLREGVYETTKRMQEALQAEEDWYAAKAQKKHAIIEALYDGLWDNYKSLLGYIEEHAPVYYTVVQFQRYYYSFGILAHLRDRLHRYRAEQNVMLISDVNAFLKSIIGENDAPFIYEKSGSRFASFLIDEFQDTSAFQWSNFKPLIENSLAQSHHNVLVGDAKQSIYRWRGGDWSLLSTGVQRDLQHFGLQENVLATNYRSLPVVIGFNNSIFNRLPALLKQLFLQKTAGSSSGEVVAKTEADTVEALYRDVRQEVAQSKSNDPDAGYVRLQFSERADNTDEWKSNTLEALPDVIKSFQDKGYRAGDIAVLVRKKAEGLAVAQRLLLHQQSAGTSPYNFQVVSNESLFLNASPAIRLLIHCVRYLLNPDDQVAYHAMLIDYHEQAGEALAPEEVLASAMSDDGQHALPESITTLWHDLKKKPLIDLMNTLIAAFALDKKKENVAFLQVFQDAVLQFSEDNASNLFSFLEWWDAQGKQIAVEMPENTDAIQVLTIHKSKGLQFKVVLIPFCEWSLERDPGRESLIWCATNQWPFSDFPKIPMRYGSGLMKTIFSVDYFREMSKKYVDNLNLLYVAFTRAEEALWINCRTPEKTEPEPQTKTETTSDLLFHAMHFGADPSADVLPHFDTERYVFEKGNTPLVKVEVKPTHQWLNLDHFKVSEWQERIQVRRQGAAYFNHTTDAAESKINFGLVLHTLLSRIEDASGIDDELQRMRAEGLVAEVHLPELADHLERIFAIPMVAGWFEAGWKVKAEAPILQRNGAESRPDRVMIRGRHAIVVDFKSGVQESGHKHQLRHYKLLLQNMGYQPVQAFLLYTTGGTLVEI
jgi:ATP-dependent exoDNAse (exonuclease V) beta subunit